MNSAPNGRRRSGGPRWRSGFTLIEVLVVVAIIALLVSILLPSLRSAREQAKISVCLANLGTIGKGAMAYLNAERERFCWGEQQPDGSLLLRTWYFGGNRGQDSPRLGTEGFYYENQPYDWPAGKRPLNKYVYAGAKLPTKREQERRPLRQAGPLRVYECPSDQGVRWNSDPNSELHDFSTPAYLEVGTSYQANESYSYYARDPDGQGSADRAAHPDTAARVRHLTNRIVHILRKRGPSRAILIYEDSADWALNVDLTKRDPKFRVRTWHNKYDIHNILFMDGHVGVTKVDWRRNMYHIDENSGTGTWVARHSSKDN